MLLNHKELFHVHTYRCGHAGEEQDIEYIEEAIGLGAKKLVFTEHAPFPKDVFQWRMPMVMLEDYIKCLSALKEEYKELIDIHIGLEAEYLPFFDGYYKELLAIPEIEFLLLGQHFAEYEPGFYSFMEWREDTRKCMAADMIAGIRSGYFSVVAHPDRIFRNREGWKESFRELAIPIIEAAKEARIPLEQNEGSKASGDQYFEEFWKLAEEIGGIQIVHGLDAHSVEELRTRAERIDELV